MSCIKWLLKQFKKTEREIPDISPYEMTEQDLIEKLKSPNYGILTPQIYAGFCACLSSMSFGTSLAWSCPVSWHLNDTNTHGDDEKKKVEIELLSTIVLLGCACGMVPWSYSMSRAGPRKTLIIQAPFYLITWSLFFFNNISTHIMARFSLGFISISHWICSRTLLRETVHQKIKKYIIVFYNIAFLIGILIVHILAKYLNKNYISMTCGLVAILHFLLLMPLPESPAFLYKKNETLAIQSLTWYRGMRNAYDDINKIRMDREHFRLQITADTSYLILHRTIRVAVLRICLVEFVQISSGYYIFLFFCLNIFIKSRFCSESVYMKHERLITLTVFIISKLIWEMVHKLKTDLMMRPLLITSCFLIAVKLAFLAIYFGADHYNYINSNNNKLLHYNEWVPLILVIGIVFIYDMGLGYYEHIILADYTPHQAYNTVKCFTEMFKFLMLFIYSYFFSMLNCSSFIKLGIMSMVMLLGAILCYKYLVEVTNQSLIQIQIALGCNPLGTRRTLDTRIVNDSDCV